MTLLSANQNAYIFRANDNEWYRLSPICNLDTNENRQSMKNPNSKINSQASNIIC